MYTIFREKHPALAVLAGYTVQATEDLVFWVRNDGTFAFVSQPMLDLLEYTPEEMERMRVTDLLADYGLEDRTRLRQRIDASGVHYVRASLRAKDGSYRAVESRNNRVEAAGETFNVAFCRLIFVGADAKTDDAPAKPRRTAPNVLYQACDALGIVGASRALVSTLTRAANYARNTRPVLIRGETGVGKESLAKLLHHLSDRHAAPFEPVNCGTVTDDLAVSNLFGHVKGAFTGAVSNHPGVFARAGGGTVFLDEVGELSLPVQTMLLRVLQNGEYLSLGETRVRRADVRVVAATNRDLRAMIAEGAFREDLFHRLNVLRLELPPLRERGDDLDILVRHCIAHLNRTEGLDRTLPSPAELVALRRYPFPGNIRELFGLLERAYFDGYPGPLQLAPELLDLLTHQPVGRDGVFISFKENERRHLLRVLAHCNWKVGGKGGAAEILEMNRSTLISRMKKLGIRGKDDFLEGSE